MTDLISLLRSSVSGIFGGAGSGGGSSTLSFPAHVLAICLDESSDLYDNDPTNIGMVVFRDLSLSQTTPLSEQLLRESKDKGNVAYPADRNNIKYPYPGEQILIVIGIGDKKLTNKDTVAGRYYYTSTLATTNNSTFNSQPFLGSNPSNAAPNTPSSISQNRLLATIKDLSKVITFTNLQKFYKQLKPREGDYIIQGRFGNTLRFGSTSAVDDPQGSGASGDPITVLRVDRALASDAKEVLVDENPDSDDSSIYLCSSQKVSFNLSATDKFKTWKKDFAADNDPKTLESLGLKNKNNFKANNYGGSQILITSDRLIFNSREDYILLFGGAGVGLNSPKSINIEAGKAIRLYGEDGVFLGVPNKGEDFPPPSAETTYNADGYESAVLGNKLESIMKELIQTIKNAKIIFSVDGSTWASETRDQLNKIQASLPEVLSTSVFLDGVSRKQADPSIGGASNELDNTSTVGSTSSPVTSQVGSTQPSTPTNTTPSQATNIPPQGSSYSATDTISLYQDSV